MLLEYDGTGSDQELIKALDQKYDALKDKLLLEALKKQLGMSCRFNDRYLLGRSISYFKLANKGTYYMTGPASGQDEGNPAL